RRVRRRRRRLGRRFPYPLRRVVGAGGRAARRRLEDARASRAVSRSARPRLAHDRDRRTAGSSVRTADAGAVDRGAVTPASTEPPRRRADRILLDTSSMMYRAFFSMPTSVRDPSGRATNALYGYLDMTARLIGSRQPSEVVHVYDANWRPDERVALYAGYKANRPPDPEELPSQFDRLRELLDST